MTDYNRRRSDERIGELEASLKTHITKALDNHVDKDHYPISHAEIDVLIYRGDRMVDMIEGTPITDLSGNVVGHENGMKQMVEQIYERTNGGITVIQQIKPVWTRRQRIAAWTGMGMIVTQFAAVMVTVLT